MVFSTNQNRQLYVAKKLSDNGLTDPGDIKLCGTADKKQIFFEYMGYGGPVRSDLIDVDKICYLKVTKAKDLERKLKKVTVSLDSSINEGNPLVGQDYVLRIAIRSFVAPGEENVYYKYGMVHGYSELTKEEFYKKLAESLKKNFSRELTPMFDFKADNSTGVEITELEQPWVLGTMEQEFLDFTVSPTLVRYQGDDVIWGTVKVEDSDQTVGNGKRIADLEYFCMGERGDQYRNVGFPHVIPTKYMVDPSKTYDVLDMHYFFSDTGVNSYKSEKDLTIVVDSTTESFGLLDKLKEYGINVDEEHGFTNGGGN